MSVCWKTFSCCRRRRKVQWPCAKAIRSTWPWDDGGPTKGQMKRIRNDSGKDLLNTQVVKLYLSFVGVEVDQNMNYELGNGCKCVV